MYTKVDHDYMDITKGLGRFLFYFVTSQITKRSIREHAIINEEFAPSYQFFPVSVIENYLTNTSIYPRKDMYDVSITSVHCLPQISF